MLIKDQSYDNLNKNREEQKENDDYEEVKEEFINHEDNHSKFILIHHLDLGEQPMEDGTYKIRSRSNNAFFKNDFRSNTLEDWKMTMRVTPINLIEVHEEEDNKINIDMELRNLESEAKEVINEPEKENKVESDNEPNIEVVKP